MHLFCNNLVTIIILKILVSLFSQGKESMYWIKVYALDTIVCTG